MIAPRAEKFVLGDGAAPPRERAFAAIETPVAEHLLGWNGIVPAV